MGPAMAREGYVLAGAAAVLVGVAVLVYGVGHLRGANVLKGIAAVLVGAAILLFAVDGFRRNGLVPFGAEPYGAFMLLGVAVMLYGVGRLRGANIVMGIAFLLGGVAVMLGEVLNLRGGKVRLWDAAGLLGDRAPALRRRNSARRGRPVRCRLSPGWGRNPALWGRRATGRGTVGLAATPGERGRRRLPTTGTSFG
jgi:hypothetical protein